MSSDMIPREQHEAEMAALREQVRTTARRYATTHGWCDTVEKALKEAGVIEPNLRYRVAYQVTYEDVILEAEPGLTDEQILGKARVAADGRTGDRVLLSKEVTQIPEFGKGYNIFFISRSGYRQHLLTDENMRRHEEGRSARSLCGKDRTVWVRETQSASPVVPCRECRTISEKEQ